MNITHFILRQTSFPQEWPGVNVFVDVQQHRVCGTRANGAAAELIPPRQVWVRILLILPRSTIPICSLYGNDIYLHHPTSGWFRANVGKYSSTMVRIWDIWCEHMRIVQGYKPSEKPVSSHALLPRVVLDWSGFWKKVNSGHNWRVKRNECICVYIFRAISIIYGGFLK